MLGKIEGRKRRGRQRVKRLDGILNSMDVSLSKFHEMRQRVKRLDGILNSMDVSLSKFHEMVKGREAGRAAVHGVTQSRTQLGD